MEDKCKMTPFLVKFFFFIWQLLYVAKIYKSSFNKSPQL